jgi:hypothetical protein
MATTLRPLVTTEEDASSASYGYGGALRAMGMGELCELWGSSGGAPNLLRFIVYLYMEIHEYEY